MSKQKSMGIVLREIYGNLVGWNWVSVSDWESMARKLIAEHERRKRAKRRGNQNAKVY